MTARGLLATLLLAGAAFLPAAGRGEEAPAGRPAPADVAVTLKERNLYEVEGCFRVSVPRAVAWEVLTDYEGIGTFVPAVNRSWVAEREEGGAMVGQDLAGGWLFFSRRVRLRLKVRESPPTDIRFEDLSGEDFVSYSGGWTLEEGDGGTWVTYRLRAEPKFHVPGFITRGAFKSAARDLLRGVRMEMIRRGRKP